jgi:hypothetical protein
VGVRKNTFPRYDHDRTITSEVGKKSDFLVFPLKARLSTRGTLSHDMGTIGPLLQKLEKK